MDQYCETDSTSIWIALSVLISIIFCTPKIGFSVAGVGSITVERTYGTGVNRFVGPPIGLRFCWNPCFTCDFYQVRWAKEGTAEVQEQQAKSAPQWPVYNITPGARYIFKVQACERGLFGSSCSAWSEINSLVPRPPTQIEVSDTSYWNERDPMFYEGRLTFNWRPAVAVDGLRIQMGDRPIELDPYATNREFFSIKPGESVNLTLCAYIHEYDHLQQKRVEVSAGCVSKSGAVAVPLPKTPARVRIDVPAANMARVYWAGDNVTALFDIERLEQSRRLTVVEASQLGKPLAAGQQAKVNFPGETITAQAGGVIQTHPSEKAASTHPTPQPFWRRVKTIAGNGRGGVFSYDDRFDASVTRPSDTSIYQPYTYRVCAGNVAGTTCSAAVIPHINPTASGAAFKGNLPVQNVVPADRELKR